ncbi:hypothetical protein PoB_002087400, partial [Plakobranchus ocellatus]
MCWNHDDEEDGVYQLAMVYASVQRGMDLSMCWNYVDDDDDDDDGDRLYQLTMIYAPESSEASLSGQSVKQEETHDRNFENPPLGLGWTRQEAEDYCHLTTYITLPFASADVLCALYPRPHIVESLNDNTNITMGLEKLSLQILLLICLGVTVSDRDWSIVFPNAPNPPTAENRNMNLKLDIHDALCRDAGIYQCTVSYASPTGAVDSLGQQNLTAKGNRPVSLNGKTPLALWNIYSVTTLDCDARGNGAP